MNRRGRGVLVLLTALVNAATPGWSGGATPPPAAYAITPAQFWRTQFGDPNWHVIAGDADGDGCGDLLAVRKGDSIVQMARTSPLGKVLPENTARPAIGPGVVVALGGPFVRRAPAADILAVYADGSIKLTSGMAPGTDAFTRTEAAGMIPKELVPQTPARAAVADFDGDGRSDVLILDKAGKLLALKNGGGGTFTAVPIRTKLGEPRQFDAGSFVADKAGRCVWLDVAGTVTTALVDLKTGALGASKIVGKGSPDDHLVVGRFRGEKASDILVGQRLIPGGDPKATPLLLKELPPLAVAKVDGTWEVADIDGNGKDDLIRHRVGPERWGGSDVYVHFSYAAGEDKGFYSTANDGLPDVWKTGKIKPGGLDLAALGCKVGHRDVIVEIESFENFNRDELRANMNRAIQYFASIPLANPDGTTGIALHIVYKGPWTMKDRDRVIAQSDAMFPPRDRRGVIHTMIAEAGGPLVSAINGDIGHFNGHWQEFVHEFGHQLDLSHDGFYGSGSGWTSDTGSAIYPSLMSYTYSYGYDNQGDWVRYSDGKRASFVLHPQHLSERLPFPFEAVRFLGAEPYHYRVQTTPGDQETLIDWNWNGVLGEPDVSACVNYTHGLDCGPQTFVAKTKWAPAIVAHGTGKPRPLLVYGTGTGLAARAWTGRNRDADLGSWSPEANDEGAGMTGDPTAAYLGGGATWVAYPTARGTVLRRITLDGQGKPIFGEATVIPGTAGAQPTVAALDGRLVLLLWRGRAAPVGMTLLTPNETGLTKGGERPLDLLSDVPVAAVAGKVGRDAASLWVVRIQSDGGDRGGQTEAVRYEVGPNGGSRAAYRSWLSGRYARHRMTVLWREEPGNLPEGRVYQFAGGSDPLGPNGQEQWITMNTPYPDWRDGWLYRRYRNPGFRSQSAVGACFFEGDIVYAVREHDNDNLNVSFYGSGATPWPTGDFDDVGHIRDYGLSRSLRGFAR